MVMDMEHVAALTIRAALTSRSYTDVAAITDAVMDYGINSLSLFTLHLSV
jgi:hypothetical protein